MSRIVLVTRVDHPCRICPKIFFNTVDLKDHVRHVHRAPDLTCCHCSYTTKYKWALAKHISRKHSSTARFTPCRHGLAGRDRRKSTFLKCSLCNSFECEDRSVMIDHYVEMHDVQIVEEQLDFADINVFNDWKKETEASQCFRFVENNSYKTKAGDRKVYRCFRDGFFQTTSTGKRRLKTIGSCKMNGVCPCSLKILTSKITGAVKASYIECHVGHAMDVIRMNSTKEKKRRSIAEKLSQNLCKDHIVTISNNKTKIATPPVDREPSCDGEFFMTGSYLEEEIVYRRSAKPRAVQASSTREDVVSAIEDLKGDFSAILLAAKTMDAVDVIRRALASVPNTIKALENGLIFKARET